MAIDLKQQSRRLLEDLFSKGQLELIDQNFDPRYQGSDPMEGKLDIEGFKRQVLGYRQAFPDLKLEVQEQVSEGNLVVTRWKCTGTHRGPLGELPPTGKSATVNGITIAEYSGGKLIRDHTEWDALGLFRQLGVGAGAQPEGRSERTGAEARH
jgi:steroid delta-isomerase-like uncharacterized protein